MATDPSGWFLASQALDHHGTVAALTEAMHAVTEDELALAADTAAELGRQGYGLVRLTPEAELAHDLTTQVDAHLAEEAATSWFARKED